MSIFGPGESTAGADLENFANPEYINVQEAAAKHYADTQDSFMVLKRGNTMFEALAMIGNVITHLASPSYANNSPH